MNVDNGVARIARDEAVDHDELNAELPDVIVLELVRPKEFGGEGETKELRFEEPTGEDIEIMTKAGNARATLEASWRVLGRCTGLAPDEVKKLGGRDLTRLGEALGYFLPERRRSPI